MKELLEKAKRLPEKPGVYFMKDENDSVIYVGKARNLKNRVSSYFLKGQKDRKTEKLKNSVHSFSVMIVSSEEEALLLERNAIKEYKPKFNILLRDDKEFPYLEIDYKEPWPRLRKVRRKKNKEHLYFGPFTQGTALTSVLHNIYEIFPLIRCTQFEFERRKKPCHYYHMKKCLAPCVLDVKQRDYKNIIDSVISTLEGNDKNLLVQLTEKMQEAAEKESYELAASYRDQIEAFRMLKKRQNITNMKEDSCDVITLVTKEDVCCFNILLIRNNKLISQEFYLLEDNVLDEEETLRDFLLEYYSKIETPKKIYLPFDLSSLKEVAEFLGKNEALFKKPQKGNSKKILDLSRENAFHHLEEFFNKKSFSKHNLEEIKQVLKLKKLPKTIECLDISNLGEKATVGSLVCFKDLKASKDDYKIYHIRSHRDKPDDFESIREVIRRRLERAKKEDDLPDLFVIDGGKGQLSSAKEIFHEMNIDCDLISLAKDKTKTKNGDKFNSGERVCFPLQEKTLLLDPHTITFRILTQIRDEAHRFALHHHRKKRSKEFFSSPLLEIKGVGPSLRVALLEKFGSLERLREASLEELTSLPRVSEKLAKEIKKVIGKST